MTTRCQEIENDGFPIAARLPIFTDDADEPVAKGDKDVQKVTWNTNANATLAKCTDESGWAKVNAGTYVAQLSLKDHPKVKSDPVTFTVQ